MRGKPYIGTTGFTNFSQVLSAGDALSIDETGPRWMVGILMNARTLRGEPSKQRPERHPGREVINSLFSAHARAMNIIHYASSSSDEERLYELMAIVGTVWDGKYNDRGAEKRDRLGGFQLNMAWPSPKLIDSILHLTDTDERSLEIILQVGGHALAEVHDNPDELADGLKHYQDQIDYVLIDPSGGTGKPMDVRKMHDYVQAIYEGGNDIGVGIAGGLSADNLDEIEPLIAKFPDLSIDAEGKFFDPSGIMRVDLVKNYLTKGFEMYSKHPVT
jgi:hypothetical protein